MQKEKNVYREKERDSFRESVLKKKKKKEWVTMTLPDKPKSKSQRYVITEKDKKEI